MHQICTDRENLPGMVKIYNAVSMEAGMRTMRTKSFQESVRLGDGHGARDWNLIHHALDPKGQLMSGGKPV